MGALSLQALGLFLILAPACVFFLSFTFAKGTVRPEFQRGVIMDTALFVLAAALLHTVAGGVYIGVLEATFSCRVLGSIAQLVSERLVALSPNDRCSLNFGAVAGLVYILALTVVAAGAGLGVMWLVSGSTRLYRAFYGPFHEPKRRGEADIVIADVITDLECDGTYLMYEGQLDEISISGDRKVNYICLIAPKRFYMTVSKEGTATTDRAEFVRIDRNGSGPSRLVIPGDSIKNFLTRTHRVVGVPPNIEAGEGRSTRRSMSGIRWLTGTPD